jgi:hypothetical protein
MDTAWIFWTYVYSRKCEIGKHYLTWCSVLQCGRISAAFWRNILPSSENFYRTIRRYTLLTAFSLLRSVCHDIQVFSSLKHYLHNYCTSFKYTHLFMPITVTACSNTGIVGSNLSRFMDVCSRLFCVCVVLCICRGIATGWSPYKESY